MYEFPVAPLPAWLPMILHRLSQDRLQEALEGGTTIGTGK